MPTALPEANDFGRFSSLELDQEGHLVDDGRRVPTAEINRFLRDRIYLERGTTDVFVWVHGWQHTRETARDLAARLFAGIEAVYADRSSDYRHLGLFAPEFVSVHWPSKSRFTSGGYRDMRDRAHKMTEDGHAEYVLSSLLGYLDSQQPPGGKESVTGVLQTKGGFYLHGVAHSFGGRFLCEAIAAAAAPQPPKGILRAAEGRFPYTLDSALIFQMAAPPDIFERNAKLGRLVKEAPIRGAVCLTHSGEDRANCSLHQKMEGVPAIGCIGANGPAGAVGAMRLRPLDEAYTQADLAHDLVNVDAEWIYNDNPWYSATGAHSDIWYEESIHLLLSLANLARS